jgi:hypothetical protein
MIFLSKQCAWHDKLRAAYATCVLQTRVRIAGCVVAGNRKLTKHHRLLPIRPHIARNQDKGPPIMGFLLRWICAFLLLAATFNPTEYNYVQWVRSFGGMNISIAVLAGLVLLVGYIIYLRATLRSIGGFGMVLVLALVGAGIWVLYDLGVLRLEDPSMNVWLGLGALSFVLAIGLSWSIVRRALSGQADVDDVDV